MLNLDAEQTSVLLAISPPHFICGSLIVYYKRNLIVGHNSTSVLISVKYVKPELRVRVTHRVKQTTQIRMNGI